MIRLDSTFAASRGLVTTGVIGIDTTNFLVAGIAVAPQVAPPGGGGNNAPLPAAVLVAPVGAALAGMMSRRWRKRRV